MPGISAWSPGCLRRAGLRRSPTGASEALWLVIDHADLEMQRRFMPLVEEQMEGRASFEIELCHASGPDADAGKTAPQRYGTQTRSFTRIIEGDSIVRGQRVCYVWPVEHPASLDSLRAMD